MQFADEDVKIYKSEDEAPSTQSEGEKSAAEFIYHKDSGNFEKTRQLGELLARTLVDDASRLKGDEYYNAKMVLLSYLVVDELEAKVPNLMLQKSILGVFNKVVEDLSPEIFEIVRDSAAYTLYILNDRQGERKSSGEVMAELCGKEEDREFIRDVDRLADEYRDFFSDLIQSYHFK